VKYKPAGDVPSRDDLNQTIAYAASYRCDRVIVAQPRSHDSGPLSGLRILGTIGGLTVYQYVFDLAASDLPEEEIRFTNEVATLAAAQHQAGLGGRTQ
jgi:hypothetical protein